jgi:NAD(P)-dependent dehydrogenase (short-subunit alcohol dehydrogenase family)
MVKRGSGAVIMIASVVGRIGIPYVAAYTAAKHGVVGLTRALASEYARSNVTFNAVCPGYVDTPMTDDTIESIVKRTGRSREDAARALHTPQGRLVHPAEVASVCLLLASPGGASINGQAIVVDGGSVQG